MEVIDGKQKKKWSKNGALGYAMMNTESCGVTVEDRGILESVGKIVCKPLERSTSDTIVRMFPKTNVMIVGVESFQQIYANNNDRGFITENVVSAINKFDDSHIGGMVRAEAKQFFEENVKMRSKARKTIKNKGIKDFGEAGQN